MPLRSVWLTSRMTSQRTQRPLPGRPDSLPVLCEWDYRNAYNRTRSSFRDPSSKKSKTDRWLVLLRLVGATRRQLVATQLIEFAALSVGAAAIALGVGIAAAWAVVTMLFEFDFVPDWPMLLSLGPGAVAVAIAAALAAAWPALSEPPSRALRAT